MERPGEDPAVSVGEVVLFAGSDEVEFHGPRRIRQLARIVLIEAASIFLRAEMVVLGAERAAVEMGSTAARLTRLRVDMEARAGGKHGGLSNRIGQYAVG